MRHEAGDVRLERGVIDQPYASFSVRFRNDYALDWRLIIIRRLRTRPFIQGSPGQTGVAAERAGSRQTDSERF